MNNRQKIILATYGGLVLINYVNYRQVRKAEIKKRTEIARKLSADIAAITLASERIQAKIANGSYRPTSLEALHIDQEFETIAAHYE